VEGQPSAPEFSLENTIAFHLEKSLEHTFLVRLALFKGSDVAFFVINALLG
jgi:hypothetical protein